MKSFDVPIIYRSPLISAIKKKRKEMDRMKKPADPYSAGKPAARDFTPTLLDFGPLQIFLARHFGFCFGVENAIEIAFRTIEENPGKNIYLLSEMIHNPQVNSDLKSHGVQFLQDTYGNQLLPFETLQPDDIVLIPAFGTTLEIEDTLRNLGIQTEQYNTTCPFVEKVWNRSSAIGQKEYTIVIHGKPAHEETRATFSHASRQAAAVVVKNMEEAVELGKYILGEKPAAEFYKEFSNQYSENFDVVNDLRRIGVVNQTTMLASDTQAIADYLKEIMLQRYGPGKNGAHFADTRDTLCYATLDNQTSVHAMLQTQAQLAIVAGGYNSSNTSHLVALCEEKLPTYFINNEENILSATSLLHYDFHIKQERITENYLPAEKPVKILMTSGASCPDALVEGIITKMAGLFPGAVAPDEILKQFA